MADGMTAMVCTVVNARRCEVVTDGAHSRVAHAGGVWWRWLAMGGWTQSARVAPKPARTAPTLLELAASVPRGERAEALAAIRVTT